LLDRLEPFELLLRQRLGEAVLFGLLRKQPIRFVPLERNDAFDGLCSDTSFATLQTHFAMQKQLVVAGLENDQWPVTRQPPWGSQ
jgi:hypothetical protein